MTNLARFTVPIPADRRHVLAELKAGTFVLAPAPVPEREPGDEYGSRAQLSIEPAVVSRIGNGSVTVVVMPWKNLPAHARDWMRSFASSRAALTAMGDGIGVRSDLPQSDAIYTNARTP